MSALFFLFFTTSFESPDFSYSTNKATLRGLPFSGISYQFHPNGRLYKLQMFLLGSQWGTEHRWYAHGEKWVEIEYSNGKRHGDYRIWYPDGKPKYLKAYQNGQTHGEVWGWHKNGVVSDFHIFQNGKQLVYKSFIADGKPYFNFVVDQEKRIGVQGGQFCKTKKISSL